MFIQELSNDCKILLDRALQGKEIACFGIDGFGEFGQSDRAKHYKVGFVLVELHDDQDHDIPKGFASVYLDGYKSTEFGHIVTDHNFKLSLNRLLQDHDIRTDCWEYGPAFLQGNDHVVLKIHVEKLLEWY